MSKFQITVSKDCIGCGACTVTCDNFEIRDDGKAHPKQAEVTEVGCNKEAEEVCPVSAIKVKQI